MAGHSFQVPPGQPIDGVGKIRMIQAPTSDPPWMSVTTTDTTQAWTWRTALGATYTFDWGDGTVDDGIGTGGNQAVTHNYGGPGTYSIRVWVDDLAVLERVICNTNSLVGEFPDLAETVALLYFFCQDNSFTGSIPDLTEAITLGYVDVAENSLTGSIPSLTTNVDLINFYCDENSLTGSIPSLSANVDITRFYCNANAISGTIPDLTALVVLVRIFCQDNAITGYTASTLAATFDNFNASGNALTLTAVDQILTDFTTGAGGRPGAGTINLSGGTNATPTAGVKAAAVAALPGWTITTN